MIHTVNIVILTLFESYLNTFEIYEASFFLKHVPDKHVPLRL